MKRPVPPRIVRDGVRYYAYLPEPIELPKNLIGALVGNLNKAVGGDNNRYLVLGWLFADPKSTEFEPIRSEKMTPQMWHGIEKWIGSTKNDETGKWEVHPAFREEALWVFNIARWEHGNPQALSPAEVDPNFLRVFEELGGEVTKVVPRQPVMYPDEIEVDLLDVRNLPTRDEVEDIMADLPMCECGGNYVWYDDDTEGNPCFHCDVCGKELV